MQNIRHGIYFKALLLLLLLIHDKIIYELQFLKTFCYLLYNYWKSTWYQVMYKLYQQSILSSLHCDDNLHPCPCGWRDVIDNKWQYHLSSDSAYGMGKISIVNIMAFGTIIVKQKIPLFIQNNTYFLTLIELKIALIISEPSVIQTYSISCIPLG